MTLLINTIPNENLPPSIYYFIVFCLSFSSTLCFHAMTWSISSARTLLYGSTLAFRQIRQLDQFTLRAAPEASSSFAASSAVAEFWSVRPWPASSRRLLLTTRPWKSSSDVTHHLTALSSFVLGRFLQPERMDGAAVLLEAAGLVCRLICHHGKAFAAVSCARLPLPRSNMPILVWENPPIVT